MLVYRISQRKFARDLSGTGAALFGGRWNPPGTNLLYTAGSISLACLEYLVHNFHLLASKNICLVKIEIKASNSVFEVLPKNLPADWQEKSYLPTRTQQIGREFIHDGSSYILKVPSAIVPDEYNYLLSPLHSYHAKTFIKEQIDPFEIDERLLGK